MKKAVYPGTFDPVTNGHVDIIKRSLTVFDQIIVLVAHSQKKTPLFESKKRKALVEACFIDEPRVIVDTYSGLLVEYLKQNQVNTIVRGMRAVSDFEYEFQMSLMNHRMHPEVQTFLMMASEKYFFLNSTLIKEVFSHGGDVSQLVPSHVKKSLEELKSIQEKKI